MGSPRTGEWGLDRAPRSCSPLKIDKAERPRIVFRVLSFGLPTAIAKIFLVLLRHKFCRRECIGSDWRAMGAFLCRRREPAKGHRRIGIKQAVRIGSHEAQRPAPKGTLSSSTPTRIIAIPGKVDWNDSRLKSNSARLAPLLPTRGLIA
jgi:hypothetical protein